MDWLERMNQSLQYLEESLTAEISYQEAARIACCSSYHYQRMFSYITGVTLADYIRRRRLTLAALELQSGDDKIIDLALKYGYESPDAFSRAFQRLHGLSPSSARGNGVKLRAQPPISFHISIRGDRDMEYRIVEQPDFKVFGRGIRVSSKDGVNFERIPQFWAESWQNGMNEELCKLACKDAPITGESMLGVCMEVCSEQDEFTYFIGVEKTNIDVPAGYEEKSIPAATWAVFECVGPMPNAIQELNKRIYSEWFPATGFQPAAEMDIEVYPEGNTEADDYRCEVWIPVVKN